MAGPFSLAKMSTIDLPNDPFGCPFAVTPICPGAKAQHGILSREFWDNEN
jgi:hypothetical protein